MKHMNLRRMGWAARVVAYHAAYNALARHAPRVAATLQRLTRDTGRGRGREGARGADYFTAVFDDYVTIAREATSSKALFAGKRVLELGPGDTRAVALLTRIAGASGWEGLDPFDIQSRRTTYLDAIYTPVLKRRGEPRTASELLDGCVVHGSAASLLTNGRRFDVIVSRAVLEHVRDLGELFRVVSMVARDDAVWIHKIDLRDHGIRHRHPLDFLCFSDGAWNAMSSHIDLPNRERVARYLAVGNDVGLRTAWAASTHVIDEDAVESVRPSLAPRFRPAPAAELKVLGLWLVQVGQQHSAPARTLEPLGPAPHHLLSRY
jgi:hypothetical protein